MGEGVTIKLFKPFVPTSVDKPLLQVLHSGSITQGTKVDKFESDLAPHLGNKKVISVNSGTSAIQLALRLANVGAGDEVISTPMTCIATNVPIMAAGAKIVWADVDPHTGLIDPVDVRRKITRRTKAFITVDWTGMPVDYNELRTIAAEYGIKHISDAAHSLGASYEDFPVGSPILADYTCFSLQAIKTITTIDGGILTVATDHDYERGRRLRWFGVPRDNKTKFRGELDVVEWGYKFHMNDVTAVIGSVALRSLAVNVNFQRGNALRYTKKLSKYYDLFMPKGYKAKPAWWLYTVLLPNEKERSRFRKYMESEGIEVSQVHWRNDKHTVFKPFLPEKPLTGLDSYSSRMICIPNHNQLTTKDVEKVIRIMNEFAE